MPRDASIRTVPNVESDAIAGRDSLASVMCGAGVSRFMCSGRGR
jgi:hypothetical protein